MKLPRCFCRSEFWPWATRRAVPWLFLLPIHAFVASQELVVESPNKVKAAFLRNFAHYVTWPGGVFPDSHAPWHLCVVGQDPFGDTLENTVKGRVEQGHPFEVHSARSINMLPVCHIVFVAIGNPQVRRDILIELKNKPVLTVGDAPDFLREGGIIRFQVDERVRISINLDQARTASLTIPTRILEISQEIFEHGEVRKMH